MHRIPKSRFDVTKSRASQTGLRRLYNSRTLSDRVLQARASSQRTRHHRSPMDFPKSPRAAGSGYPSLKPLPALLHTPIMPCSECIQTITTMHWNYCRLPVKLKTQAPSCHSAGRIGKPLCGDAEGCRFRRKATNSRKAKFKKGETL